MCCVNTIPIPHCLLQSLENWQTSIKKAPPVPSTASPVPFLALVLSLQLTLHKIAASGHMEWHGRQLAPCIATCANLVAFLIWNRINSNGNFEKNVIIILY